MELDGYMYGFPARPPHSEGPLLQTPTDGSSCPEGYEKETRYLSRSSSPIGPLPKNTAKKLNQYPKSA